MADGGGDDGQERTEEPTEKRKQRASEEGQILTSKELMMTVSLLVGAGMALVAGEKAFWVLSEIFIDSLNFADTLKRAIPLEVVFVSALASASGIILILAFPLILSLLAAQAILGGIKFSFQSLKIKTNRLNPMKGLKRMFGMSALVELLKSILKIIAVGTVACLAIYILRKQIVALSLSDFPSILAFSGQKIVFLLIALALATMAVSALDVIYQIFKHNKSLRMTHQEIKDESKQTEGSPEVRSRIRQLQQETAQNMKNGNVADAQVVLTNPIHFSIALKYVAEEDEAPLIIAKGRGRVALEIRQMAEESQVPILQQPELTRALYFSAQVGNTIHKELYEAVAVILAYVFKGADDALPSVEIPEDFRFNERGMKTNES
jgi:flagellar biosynthetic protein FlhB